MSTFFDSPFEYCEWVGNYVLLDQSQGSCAREHRCRGHACPLAPWFEPSPTRLSKRRNPDRPAGRSRR